MARILLRRVSKRFRTVGVIRDLDLEIGDGEFFTFVGPSGCGKSTILNMIAGLETVSDGEICFDDMVVNTLSPRERDVAMVFQSYALYPHMSVYENMAFPLKMKKTPQPIVEKEVGRMAVLLGLGDLLGRKPKELSGGQRQRVALGRAIIRKPRVFLMDEPLSNLDARLRIETRAELKRLHQELRITTVYVTHDQAEALSLSDRIAVLNKGEVQQCGTPFEVYLKPANVFVGGFIGSPPMNFIRGKVASAEPLTIDLNGASIYPFLDEVPAHKWVIVGVRPEDLAVVGSRTGGCVEVGVALLEPAGSFNWVDLEWNGTRIKGNASLGEDLRPGGKAFFTPPLEKMLFFDEASGRKLS